MLEAILVYQMSLAWIPKDILNKRNKLWGNFVWSGSSDHFVHPWVRWERITTPKAFGGWGLKDFHLFLKALATKASWRLLKTHSL